ncbi:hypothetical protein KUTeg_005291 [Tegillarca granosa]|uniref:Phosphodiesterase n=1 Tax=Tegillarca granosa TaxID=220873 RepID=A0ABQ9FL88_TEGGR|nr:hypothetical protein KUTeg_005291 [Tegillarca granosa]
MGAKLKEDDVEKYLLSHPDFLKNWMSKHGTKEVMQKVVPRALLSSESDSSEESTPKQKMKKALFDKNARNSITQNMFKRYVEGRISRMKRKKKSREELLMLSEAELFMELIRDIATELDVNVLCHKILQNVSVLTNSDRGSLFLVRGSKDNKYLVSKLFDVTESSTLEESLHTEENEIKVPFGRGIAGNVAESKEVINIKNAYEDPRFNKDVDKKTGFKTHSILCCPILNYEGEVVGVAQIINKLSGSHEFTQQDEDVFKKYLIFCGIGITNAQLFELSVQEYRRNQMLLNLARGIFEEQNSLQKLVQKIMLDAQELLKCERCCVYLLDDAMEGEVIFSTAFDLSAKDGGNIQVMSSAALWKSKNADIARHVVVSDAPLNIADLELESKFADLAGEDEEGFKTRSILCMPIYNSDKKIIGVTQLINKLNGAAFNENDANIIEAFSIFTGLGIHNCQMYEDACRLMAKQSVALEVLSYHATAQKDETDKLMAAKVPEGKEIGLYTYEFNDFPMSEMDTCASVITMFSESGILNKFKIPYDVICRWTLSVKKNYRPVTYHNWRHAFNVAQTCFTMIYTGGLKPIFDELDIFTLLVGCLCHDLDHRGTNNAFQVKTASPLAVLYSTSVMEHHHFDHCIMILQSEGNNIFQSLSPDEYRRGIKMLEHSILSTDLALYFKKRGDFKAIVDAGETKFQMPERKDLLKAMMMTACDVAAITKPWDIQKEIAQLVANEFFEQGDIEKQQLGENPIAMMDREKKDELPKMQVGFIDAICIPVYKMFAEMNKKLDPMYKGVMNNRANWQALADEHEGKKTNVNGEKEPKKSVQEKNGQIGSLSKQDKQVENQEKRKFIICKLNIDVDDNI